MKPLKIITIISILIFAAAIISGLYIMKNRIGLIDGLNVGSGQYYFTDIPNWKSYFLNDAYDSPIGIPLLTTLFILWGILMYKLWTWLEKKL